jgi:Domain of unknown function (DUF4388)
MAVEGTLDLFQLPEILQLISQQKKTGILTVQGQNDIVAISFLTGRIVAADALNQTMEEGLTRILVAEGIMSQADLARALAEHPSAGGRLLDFLVERRYVTRQRLLAALRLQTYGLIEQLLRWQQGDFKFYSGEEVSYEEAFVPITVEELLLNAAEGRPVPPRPAPPVPPTPAPVPPRQSSPPNLRVVPPPEAPPAPSPRSAPASGVPAPRAVEPAPARRGPLAPVPAPPAALVPPSGPIQAAEAAPPVFRRMRVEEAAVPPAFRTVARLAALVPAVLLVAFLLLQPASLLLPFWGEAQRQGFWQAERSVLFLKIDRAAKTFFLVESHFPERLALLQQLDLLNAADLRDPQGAELRYSAREESYTVQPVDGKGAPIRGAETTDAVTGNFLLDSDFISVSPDAKAPLVLLD